MNQRLGSLLSEVNDGGGLQELRTEALNSHSD